MVHGVITKGVSLLEESRQSLKSLLCGGSLESLSCLESLEYGGIPKRPLFQKTLFLILDDDYYVVNDPRMAYLIARDITQCQPITESALRKLMVSYLPILDGQTR